MKVINSNGFTNDEREQFKPLIFGNIITNIVTLLEASQRLGLPIAEENTAAKTRLFALDVAQDFPESGILVLSIGWERRY
jgi:hypothetical protein